MVDTERDAEERLLTGRGNILKLLAQASETSETLEGCLIECAEALDKYSSDTSPETTLLLEKLLSECLVRADQIRRSMPILRLSAEFFDSVPHTTTNGD